MSDKIWKEKYQRLFNMEKEKDLFEETFSLLQRVTKAREVAEIVAKLFGVGLINSEIVVTKAFIEILLGVAVNLKTGNSVNNVREHINNVITRDRWKNREKENRQSPPYKIGADTVTLNITFTFDRDKFALIQEIIHQANMILSQVTLSHFDGDLNLSGTFYQINGTVDCVSSILHRIYDEVGENALSDICYTSVSNSFERNHLTLSQAIQLAGYEH